MTGFGWPFAGACSLSLLSYCIAFVQIRRGFPDRIGRYAGEFLMAAVGVVVAGVIKDMNPTLLAAGPAAIFAIALLASKGNVALLIKDGRFNDGDDPDTEKARGRFAVLAFTGMGIAIVAGFLIGA